MADIDTLAPNVLAQIRKLYDEEVCITVICKRFEIPRKAFYDYRRAHGWPLRRQTKPERAPPEAMIARLEYAVADQFARAEKALQRTSTKSMETRARTLASLVKSLAELKRMTRDDRARDAHDPADPRDRPPRELAELRAELARRIERLTGSGPTE